MALDSDSTGEIPAIRASLCGLAEASQVSRSVPVVSTRRDIVLIENFRWASELRPFCPAGAADHRRSLSSLSACRSQIRRLRAADRIPRRGALAASRRPHAGGHSRGRARTVWQRNPRHRTELAERAETSAESRPLELLDDDPLTPITGFKTVAEESLDDLVGTDIGRRIARLEVEVPVRPATGQ